jgi:hypothetical protein
MPAHRSSAESRQVGIRYRRNVRIGIRPARTRSRQEGDGHTRSRVEQLWPLVLRRIHQRVRPTHRRTKPAVSQKHIQAQGASSRSNALRPSRTQPPEQSLSHPHLPARGLAAAIWAVAAVCVIILPDQLIGQFDSRWFRAILLAVCCLLSAFIGIELYGLWHDRPPAPTRSSRRSSWCSGTKRPSAQPGRTRPARAVVDRRAEVTRRSEQRRSGPRASGLRLR